LECENSKSMLEAHQAGYYVNLHDEYDVVQGGTVVEIWPILARGPGRAPTPGLHPLRGYPPPPGRQPAGGWETEARV
jgi:hypothetical protein